MLLRFSLFKELDVTQCVGGNDTPDGTDTVRRITHLFVRIQDEIRGVDDLSTLFPECADLVGISRHFKSVSHGKSELQFFNGLSRFVEGVGGQSDDIDIFLFELFDV